MGDTFYNPISIAEITSNPANAASGFLKLFVKTDGNVYAIDTSGIVTQLTNSGSTDSTFPYYIPSGTTFVVPQYKQGLFSMRFIADGVIQTDGIMVEVY